MNTQSHAIINLFLLRKIFGERKHNIPYFHRLVIFGSILPDLPMFLFFFYYTFLGVAQETIWGELFFRQDWQALFNMFNSLPLFLVVVLTAIIIKNKSVFVFGIAAIMHFVGDMFLHQEDGHAHFFPLSEYKFHSPVSYWNPEYFGGIFSIFETLLILALSVPLWKGLKNKWARTLIIIVNLFNIFSWFLWYVIFRVF
jgi:hypothetical protein